MPSLERGTNTKKFKTPKKTKFSVSVEEADNGFVITKRDDFNFEDPPVKRIAKDRKEMQQIVGEMV